MKYSFHAEAEKELNDAIDYYNECQNGLGFEFVEEVHITIENILSFPHAWAPLSPNTRRCLTNRFPYGVIYQITHDENKDRRLMKYLDIFIKKCSADSLWSANGGG